MSHPNDTPHLSHAAYSLMHHMANIMQVRLAYEEQGMSTPQLYLDELQRCGLAMKELLERDEKVRKEQAHYRPSATTEPRKF
jgi:hypothetical protein